MILLLSICAPVLNPCTAQWSGDGVQVFNVAGMNADCCPDSSGGLWVAQMNRPLINETRIVVQHIDSSGYRTFNQEGVEITSMPNPYLCGVESSLNGDCVVMFSCEVWDGDDYDLDIYAQRINQQGERLWGENGVDISTPDFPIKMPTYYDIGSSTESDDAGGMWGIWGPGAGSVDVYLCGVNADGTSKLPDGDIHVCTSVQQLECIFTKDGQGGLTVVYGNYQME